MSSCRPLLLALLCLCGLLLAACGGEDPQPTAEAQDREAQISFPTTVSNCGQQVTIDQRPERVLTVGTSAVNVLHAAGAADRITARSGEFGAPPQDAAGQAVKDVEILTDQDPATEAIIGSGVDLVIGYGLFESSPEALRSAGIASLVLTNSCEESGNTSTAASLDAVYADIERLGRLFGTAEQASRAVAELKRRVQVVREEVGDLPERTAASAYFFGDAPSTSGNRNIIHSMMTTLGLRNVFGDVDKDYIEANTEQLIARDPDVLILSYGTGGPEETFADVKAKFLRLPGTRDMTAVREDRILAIPAALREPGPGAVDGLEQLAQPLQELP